MMKAKEKLMPIAQQLRYIRSYLTNRGIEPHGTELDDLMDSTLHYDENKAAIMEYYGMREEIREPTEAEFVMDQLERINSERTERARMQDYHQRHSETVSVKELLKDEKKINRWIFKPGTMDIIGIDVKEGLKKSKKKRKKVKRKIKRSVMSERLKLLEKELNEKDERGRRNV